MQADLAGGDIAFTVDVLVTWIGAVALGRSALALGRRTAHSTLERRARFLIGALAAMFFLRGLAWLNPGTAVLAYLVSVPNSLLPLAMTLFVEGLLRRHVPRWMKWLATVATVVAFVANLIPFFDNSARTGALIGYAALAGLAVTMAALGVVLARADRSSLSRSENALIGICGLVVALSVPLAITDYRSIIGWPMVRMGTLGGLLLGFSILGRPQEVTINSWLRDMRRLVLRALLACALLAIALQTLRAELLLPLSVLAIAVVFALAVWDRVRDLETTSRGNDLLEWLAREPPASRDAFAADLQNLRLTADAVVVADTELAAYDHGAIVRAFPPGAVVHSLARLRAMRESEAQAARGADDLADLLERRGATHVGLLSAAPLFLLVVTIPDIGSRGVELALSAVARRWPRTTPMTHVAAD